jgi:hypothetical protein
MAFTYDDTNLVTTTDSGRLNFTRLLIGDTNANDPILQDAEIVAALSVNGNNVYFAGSWSARVIAAKYSREVNTKLDGQIEVDYSELAKQFISLADNLSYLAKTQGAVLGVAAGGISRTAMAAVRENTDRVTPSFRRDRFHNPPKDDGPYTEYD